MFSAIWGCFSRIPRRRPQDMLGPKFSKDLPTNDRSATVNVSKEFQSKISKLDLTNLPNRSSYMMPMVGTPEPLWLRSALSFGELDSCDFMVLLQRHFNDDLAVLLGDRVEFVTEPSVNEHVARRIEVLAYLVRHSGIESKRAHESARVHADRRSTTAECLLLSSCARPHLQTDYQVGRRLRSP